MTQECTENEKWIPVTSSLPDDLTWVLATVSSPNDKWVDIVGFACGKFHLPGRGDTNFVTHWMPLPDPAKD